MKRNAIFAAAVFALALPNLAFAEVSVEPVEITDESDGAEVHVQLDEEPSDKVSEENAGDVDIEENASDEGSEENASDHRGTDVTDENTDLAEENGSGATEENEVAEVEDTWATANGGGGGGGSDGEGPIYLEFAEGNGPEHRDNLPLGQEDSDVALQSGGVPTAPDGEALAPILASSKRFDATLDINVHDKVAVSLQCAVLLDTGETYQAFYKLYCD